MILLPLMSTRKSGPFHRHTTRIHIVVAVSLQLLRIIVTHEMGKAPALNYDYLQAVYADLYNTLVAVNR